MDLEALRKRRAELIQGLGEARTTMERLNGALMETDMWIAKIEKALAAEEKEEDNAA